MAEIEWFYKDTGEGQLGDIVSHFQGVQDACKRKARIGAAAAAAVLAAHQPGKEDDPGPHSHVEINQGKLDWYIDLVDPGGGAHGVMKVTGALNAAKEAM